MNPFNDEYFMKQALVEARAAASEGEVPVGAVIICNNQIIARAHNQTECSVSYTHLTLPTNSRV